MVLDKKTGSPEYQTVMNKALELAIAEPRPKPRRSCHRSHSYVSNDPSPFDKSFPSFVSALFKAMLNFKSLLDFNAILDFLAGKVMPSPKKALLDPISADPISAMLQREIKTLLPFALHRGDLSSFRVRVAIPAYLQGTDLGCAIRYTSEAIFNNAVEFCNPADAAFSTLAYHLCRIPSDYWPCDTPPRLMAIEHNEKQHVAFASWIDIRVGLNTASWDISRIDPLKATDELRQWVESLVDEHDPDLLTFVGNEAMVSLLNKTTISPKIASRLVGQGSAITSQSAIALGAAQGAKELMDRQRTDCIQDQECDDIQQKADELVGEWKAENVAVIHDHYSINEHQEL